jgi:hypothetical protein
VRYFNEPETDCQEKLYIDEAYGIPFYAGNPKSMIFIQKQVSVAPRRWF